jgi:urease accessory protein
MDPVALPSPLVLQQRLGLRPSLGQPDPAGNPTLQLALTADERTRLRGLRQSVCGRDLLLQLPRGEALEPEEWLGNAEGEPLVQVVAAPEPLLVVTASDPLTLLQAAYHLGNRHVSLELQPGELRLLEDSVLERMLRQRGLTLNRQLAPFLPEAGAYSPSGHHHSHAPADGPAHVHGHDHDHDHEHGHGH